MSRLIKSEIKCISLYLEEQYIDYLISTRLHRILLEMRTLRNEIERELLEEFEEEF